MKNLLRIHLNLIAILLDSCVAGLSFPFALYLRLGDNFSAMAGSYAWPASAGFSVLVLCLLLANRTYRRVWRYTSLHDLINVTKIITIAVLVFYLALFHFTRLESLPRSVVFIHWLSLVAFVSLGRVVARTYYDKNIFTTVKTAVTGRIPVILIGATDDAEMFIRESKRNISFPYEAAAIIDDAPHACGREIHHVRIYGPLAHSADVVEKLKRRNIRAQRMIVCDHHIPGDTLAFLVEVAREHGLKLSRLPRLSELTDGSKPLDIRPVAVEDILGRPQTALDTDAMRQLVHNKRVLVTGAGGSIGSELVRQIAAFRPAQIIFYEISEFQLYEIGQEMAEDFPDIARVSIVGDVRNAAQLDRIFARYQPEIVFHAAAIKHVPMAEMNPDQAVLTNVLGSKNVVDCCSKYQVPSLVQISTDKAVNPSSVMGTTKRIAEIYAQLRTQMADCQTRIITVRFGNVLGSNGSVVPLFQRQIAKGGPVTVTHPEMTRYLMTIGEAVQLVLQAAALGQKSEEHAPIFVLEMGKPIKILILAEQMIRLAGFTPNKEIAIAFTGIRPGEKLYEELFHDQENLLQTAHQSIRKARARMFDVEAVFAQIDGLIRLAEIADEAALRAHIRLIVPEYTPFQGTETTPLDGAINTNPTDKSEHAA